LDRAGLTEVNYRPTFPGKPGCAGSSPGKPLGDAPVPKAPGVEVLGTPGGLMPLLIPVVVISNLDLYRPHLNACGIAPFLRRPPTSWREVA
jgi:hypothetical protein